MKNSLKLQASLIMRDEMSSKHKRSSSYQQFQNMRESLYEEKLREEINNQEILMKKITELSKVEEIITSNLIKSEISQDQSKRYHSPCMLVTEKNYSPDKDLNIPSIV